MANENITALESLLTTTSKSAQTIKSWLSDHYIYDYLQDHQAVAAELFDLLFGTLDDENSWAKPRFATVVTSSGLYRHQYQASLELGLQLSGIQNLNITPDKSTLKELENIVITLKDVLDDGLQAMAHQICILNELDQLPSFLPNHDLKLSFALVIAKGCINSKRQESSTIKALAAIISLSIFNRILINARIQEGCITNAHGEKEVGFLGEAELEKMLNADSFKKTAYDQAVQRALLWMTEAQSLLNESAIEHSAINPESAKNLDTQSKQVMHKSQAEVGKSGGDSKSKKNNKLKEWIIKTAHEEYQNDKNTIKTDSKIADIIREKIKKDTSILENSQFPKDQPPSKKTIKKWLNDAGVAPEYAKQPGRRAEIQN